MEKSFNLNTYKLLINLLMTGILTVTLHQYSFASEKFIVTDNGKPSDSPIIGETFQLVYSGNKSLSEIGKKYELGYLELIEANPHLHKNSFYSVKEVLIPSSRIVPLLMREGILINLAELRLYFFEHLDNNTIGIRTFPIGIGRSGYETPTGNFSVTTKLEKPTWYPPLTSRKSHPKLPLSVPPGPNNPLGNYWIQLDLEGYGIHGTNKENSIGKRVSLGCIRLFQENIEWLYGKAFKGIPVKIINMPVKFGYSKGNLYMEVHQNGLSREEIKKEARKLAEEKKIENLDEELIDKIIDEGSGIPVLLLKEKETLFGTNKSVRNPYPKDGDVND